MLNRVNLIGLLGKDPEIKKLSNGDSVANLTLATTEKWKDKKTGERQEKTEWHRINFFSPLAEICEKYLKKGSKVYIEGSIHTRKWQDNNGQDRYSTEIKGREMKMLGDKLKQSEQVQEYKPQVQLQQSKSNSFDLDDSIPF